MDCIIICQPYSDNYPQYVQKSRSTVAYSTIKVNFSDIFEGYSQDRFINLTQMDFQNIPTNDDAQFYTIITSNDY